MCTAYYLESDEQLPDNSSNLITSASLLAGSILLNCNHSIFLDTGCQFLNLNNLGDSQYEFRYWISP